jgi:hypothetical protein
VVSASAELTGAEMDGAVVASSTTVAGTSWRLTRSDPTNRHASAPRTTTMPSAMPIGLRPVDSSSS